MPYLDNWTKFMLAQGRSDATIRRYRYALHRLAGESGKDSLLEITETDVTTFLASLGKRAHSRQLYLQAFRSFFPWAVDTLRLPDAGAAEHPELQQLGA